ncbi:hypothetical protein SP90_16200 [Halodesulfovibrio spirochaetisodalis]|uniref:Uncharacterized protein n=1 Tax=Halodesulfovibrio spirochaetisodalis TaxID=1560234 RepID=A0A1B7X920_9BACT|nr:hypothetical protein SP90_16200 [Halodesulfovibrio spirochaetisodalis]
MHQRLDERLWGKSTEPQRFCRNWSNHPSRCGKKNAEKLKKVLTKEVKNHRTAFLAAEKQFSKAGQFISRSVKPESSDASKKVF